MSYSGDVEVDFDESFNFWEPKQYMKTVKRLENSYKLSQELSNLVIERAEIEKSYSTSLKKWSVKLITSLESGVEYGTNKYGWSSFAKEADEVSEIHLDIRNRLLEEVQADIKRWQKDHFHKPVIPTQQFKEIKAIETEFEYTQKPWTKRLKKAIICKKEYHFCCKIERSMNIQLQNSRNDSNISPEQLKKIDDKHKKSNKDVDRTKISYQAAVKDLEGDSARYMEEMDKIFQKSQIMEKERIEYFRDIFEKIRYILDYSKLSQLKEIYDNFKIGINEINSEIDLKNWSNSYGAAMLFDVPQFEEYTPELTGMITKKKLVAQDGITLTSVTNIGDSLSSSKSKEFQKDIKNTAQHCELPNKYDESLNPFGSDGDTRYNALNHYGNANDLSTDDDYDTVMIDDRTSGVKVRALYDYNGAEEDELCIKSGDIFERLEEEDGQGWCKGRLNGVVGLYPSNYAELV